MNLEHLAIFDAVATSPSITAAAERLMISQPAVSKQLAQLERSLGTSLFDREPRGVRLTDAGRTLAAYAARLFALADEAERAVRDASFVRSGQVAVGATPTLGTYVLPAVLVHFRRRFPLIGTTVTIADAASLARALEDGAIDVAVSDAALDAGDGRLFAREPMVAVAPPAHAIARRRSVSVAQLGALPFVFREAGHASRGQIAAALGVAPRVSVALATTGAVKQAVAAGLGVAILPASAVAADVSARRLAAIRVVGLTLRQPIYVTGRADRREAKATTAFLCLLKHGLRGSLPKLPTPTFA